MHVGVCVCFYSVQLILVFFHVSWEVLLSSSRVSVLDPAVLLSLVVSALYCIHSVIAKAAWSCTSRPTTSRGCSHLFLDSNPGSICFTNGLFTHHWTLVSIALGDSVDTGIKSDRISVGLRVSLPSLELRGQAYLRSQLLSYCASQVTRYYTGLVL